MKFIETLKNIGFSEKEARIYLSLLQTGKATAYKIAKNSGLKRPTAYVILDALSQKNLIKKIPSFNSTYYVARKPDEIFALARQRFEKAEKMLPEFKKIKNENHLSSNIYYFDGLEGIKEMYENILDKMENKEFVSFTSHLKNTPKELISYWDKFNKERRKRNIFARAITPEDETTNRWNKNQKKYLLNTKLLDKNLYNSDISIDIYDRFVQIVSYRYLQGILIDNPDIVKTMKQIFELVWKRK